MISLISIILTLPLTISQILPPVQSPQANHPCSNHPQYLPGIGQPGVVEVEVRIAQGSGERSEEISRKFSWRKLGQRLRRSWRDFRMRSNTGKFAGLVELILLFQISILSRIFWLKMEVIELLHSLMTKAE